jgi:hypothetical protein
MTPLCGHGELFHEVQEAPLELCRIQQPEHPAEGIVAWDTVRELEELAQERFLDATKQGHIGTVLGATEHGAEGDHQDFVEWVPRVILARVLQFGKAGGKPFHGASGDESPWFESILGPRRNRHFYRRVKCDSPAGDGQMSDMQRRVW